MAGPLVRKSSSCRVLNPLLSDLESQWLIILGYFKPIMVYFGVWWPLISSYVAVQAGRYTSAILWAHNHRLCVHGHCTAQRSAAI